MNEPTVEEDTTGDEALMHSLVERRQDALRMLYGRYQHILRTVALRVLHDEKDSELVR